jgi:hypothetical protein
MDEGETPRSEEQPVPKKLDRKTLLVAVALTVGLVLLVALNMN